MRAAAALPTPPRSGTTLWFGKWDLTSPGVASRRGQPLADIPNAVGVTIVPNCNWKLYNILPQVTKPEEEALPNSMESAGFDGPAWFPAILQFWRAGRERATDFNQQLTDGLKIGVI